MSIVLRQGHIFSSLSFEVDKTNYFRVGVTDLLCTGLSFNLLLLLHFTGEGAHLLTGEMDVEIKWLSLRPERERWDIYHKL